MLKVTLVSGTIVYADCSELMMGAYINSANSGKTAIMEVFKEQAKTNKITIQLRNVESFEKA